MKYGALNSIPRQTTIGGQPHMLAYINPEEESLIQDYRGNIPPVAGPDGVPAYWSWGESSFNPSNWGGDTSSSTPAASSNNNDDDDKGAIETFFDNIVEVGSNVISGTVDFVSDVGNAAVDTVTEIVTLGTADTATYNPDATSTSGTATTDTTATATDTVVEEFLDNRGVSHSTAAARDAANAQYASEASSVNDNTVLESIANFLTPNDGQTYVDSVLVNTSDAIDATVAANAGSSYDANTGKITGADGSTIGIGTNVNADDITSALYADLLPGGSAGNYDDFLTRYEATSAAAALDPYGSTTATGFLVNEGFTADLDGDGVDETYNSGTEYTVNLDGSVVVADSEGDTTGGLSLLGQDMIDLGLADPLNEGETADGSGMTDLTQVGGGDDDGLVGGGFMDEVFDGTPSDVVDYFSGDDSPITRQVRATRDLMGDFYGGQSGGLWNRFQNSYLTRFNQPTQGIDEMVRVVEAEDGTKLYYGADGALLNPDAVGQIRTSGDPTSLKIGEENVLLGTQTLNPDGTVKDTSYTDLYDPEVDAGLFNYS